jgi:hypothetical protein
MQIRLFCVIKTVYFREHFLNEWIYLHEECENSKQFIKIVICGQLNVLLFCLTSYAYGFETSTLTLGEELKLRASEHVC